MSDVAIEGPRGYVCGMAKIQEHVRRLVLKSLDSGETFYSLSKATGIDHAQLSRFANGKRGLSVDTLETLAKHYGKSIVLVDSPKRSQST